MAEPLHPYACFVGGTNKCLQGRGNHVSRPDHLCHNPRTATFIEIEGGNKLFYRVLGTGPKKIVMVMALAANHTQWEDQFKYFGIERSEDFSVCVMDNRGVGFSGVPPGRWRTTDLAQDVWRLVEKLGWSGIHLVGLSMGGMVCLEAALARPDLLSSLTLISTHGGGRGTIPPLHGLYKLSSVFRCSGLSDGVDFGIDVMFPSSFSDSAPNELPLKDRAGATRRFDIARDILVRKRYYIEAGIENELKPLGVLKQLGGIVTHYVSWKRLEYLRKTNIPILVCSGAQDNLISWRNSEMLAKALGAQHLHFADGGHCVNEQFKGEVNAAMAEVVERGHKAPSRSVKPFGPGLHPGLPLSVALLSVAYMSCSAWLWQHPLGMSPWIAMGASVLAAQCLT